MYPELTKADKNIKVVEHRM